MQCLCVSVFVQSLSPVSHNNLSQINNFLRGLPKCNLISNRSQDILGLSSRYSWLEMNPLSWSFRIITYLLAVLLFNVTIVLTSWLLQIARILLNFSFNFKYLLNACHISYTVLTTFTCMFIFTGELRFSRAITLLHVGFFKFLFNLIKLHWIIFRLRILPYDSYL